MAYVCNSSYLFFPTSTVIARTHQVEGREHVSVQDGGAEPGAVLVHHGQHAVGVCGGEMGVGPAGAGATPRGEVVRGVLNKQLHDVVPAVRGSHRGVYYKGGDAGDAREVG